jgi:hypothetical protein
MSTDLPDCDKLKEKHREKALHCFDGLGAGEPVWPVASMEGQAVLRSLPAVWKICHANIFHGRLKLCSQPTIRT